MQNKFSSLTRENVDIKSESDSSGMISSIENVFGKYLCEMALMLIALVWLGMIESI